jgi:hypothetical protein
MSLCCKFLGLAVVIWTRHRFCRWARCPALESYQSYSSGVQQPGRDIAILSGYPHTRQAAPLGRGQGRAVSLHPDAPVHPACTKHQPAAGTRGLERSARGSGETTRTTAFSQYTGINSLVIVSGQGRGRTADLPLFRSTDHRAGPSTEVSLAAQRPVVHADGRRCT